jgi:hypothetical protein
MSTFKKSSLLALCLWMSAATARAQVFPGAGDIPVIDKSNLTVNTLTSERTAATATAAGTLVTQGQLNLTPSGVYPAHDILQLITAINAVLQTGQAVHYLLPDIGAIFSGRYAGYATMPQDWWAMVELLSPSALDTLNGTLQAVHEQLNPLEWGLDTALLAALKGTIANPLQGNLSITQIQSMATVALIEELRKSRQLQGANLNAQNIAQAHHAHMQMYSERLLHDTLEGSLFPIPAYAGGYGKFGSL